MTAQGFRFVDQFSGRGPMVSAYVKIAPGHWGLSTANDNTLRYRRMTATLRFRRKTEGLLWRAVGPLLTIAVAGLLAATLMHVPALDRPDALAGPVSGHSLLHSPR